MSKQLEKPVAIIGAGIAGLTAADYLRKNNIPFVLFEAGNKIAGLATSFKDAEGFSHDFGAHFITNRLANAIGVGEECLLVKHYGETVWLKGKTYSYPFGLVQIPRMSFSWFAGQFRTIFNKQPVNSAADWFRKRYGVSLANEIALPLIEAWSGAPAKDLSPAVGDGLFGGNIAKTLYLKIAGKLTGRAVACGYNKEKPETPRVWHVYPQKGVATLCEKLAEGLYDSIHLQSPVDAIIVNNERVTAVSVNAQAQEVSAVISTAPVNMLAKLVKGSDALKGFEKLHYRPMVFINMRFRGRGLLSDTVLWFPEDKFPFFRLTEATISMPWLAPDGKTVITADIGCEKEDDIWKMKEEDIGELCLEYLIPIIPDAKERYLGCSVLRTAIAYPVFLNKYEWERQEFQQSTHIENLISIGRNGEFSHMFMEDVYWRTRRRLKDLLSNLNNNN